jgi:hypothetical protein
MEFAHKRPAMATRALLCCLLVLAAPVRANAQRIDDLTVGARAISDTPHGLTGSGALDRPTCDAREGQRNTLVAIAAGAGVFVVLFAVQFTDGQGSMRGPAIAGVVTTGVLIVLGAALACR